MHVRARGDQGVRANLDGGCSLAIVGYIYAFESCKALGDL